MATALGGANQTIFLLGSASLQTTQMCVTKITTDIRSLQLYITNGWEGWFVVFVISALGHGELVGALLLLVRTVQQLGLGRRGLMICRLGGVNEIGVKGWVGIGVEGRGGVKGKVG